MMNIQPQIWEIRPCARLGEVGLFATKSLPAGNILLSGEVFEDTWVPWQEMNFNEGVDEGRALIAKWCYFDDEGAWIPPDFNRLPAYYHINHACEPNVGHHPDDHWVALRDIAAGEELTMDYQLTCLGSWWSMDCACGGTRCLRTLRGDTWRDPDFAEQNLRHFPPYFKAKVAKHHGFEPPAP